MSKASFSPAEQLGCSALLVSGALLTIKPLWALFPLGLFLLACGIAPFIPGVGFFLPLVSRGDSGSRAVAVSFDDGPDPRATPSLLPLLATYDIQATFFVIGQKAYQHPELLSQICAQGHTLGNHSFTHDPFLALRSPGRVRQEINLAQQSIGQSGIFPLFFRPPVGITSPRLQQPVREAGLILVTFRRRSADFSNKRVSGLAERMLRQVRSGDILALHDTYPGSKERLELWLGEVEKLIVGLKHKGFEIIPLAHLVGEARLRQQGKH